MAQTVRGADLVVGALRLAGIDAVFTLSGNHVMPIFDAAFGAPIKLIHTRHEAATVYMADAWARLTGKCGVALVSSGAGHGNAVGSLPTALAADAPVLLLSGHAGLGEQGRGGFQELRQADMAAPACKASRVATDAQRLAHDIAAAVSCALSGRPGPVHLSLPVDLLNARVPDTPDIWPEPAAFAPAALSLDARDVELLRAGITSARKPLAISGPYLTREPAAQQLSDAARALGIPLVGMQSPRGLNDPALGSIASILPQADLVVLLGKPCDFTIGFAQPPAVSAACRLIVVDPDPELLERAKREIADRLDGAILADPLALLSQAATSPVQSASESAWHEAVASAIAYRPEKWPGEGDGPAELLHPADLTRALGNFLAQNSDAILVCDGGEAPQWAQTLQTGNRCIINGVGGSIGGAVPFAIGARQATGAPVIAVSGDGAFGFHLMEMDTALRHDLPVVVVVANDAAWNAEYQIQLRSYGAERAHGCKLLETRYDRVVEALGGHGEFVTRREEIAPALARAFASGKPACVNVRIASVPAPIIRQPG